MTAERPSVSVAASTSFRSTSSSGNPFTPVLMNRGFTPSTPRRHSSIHRAANCRAVSCCTNKGTPDRFAAP